jgi:membrane protein CcdC involved in cytochrome C biogenesis
MLPFTFVGSIFGALVILVWRLKEASRPITTRKIIIPPLGMSTGFCMFLFPPMQVPLTWAVTALALGATVFAYPMVHTTRLTVKGDEVWMRRSKTFFWVLLGLVGVRIALRGVIGQYISPAQTGALFYLLAFGMIVHWRVRMYFDYQRMKAEIGRGTTPEREPSPADERRRSPESP